MMVTICDTNAKPQGRLLLEVQMLQQISRGDDNTYEGKRNHLLLSVLMILCLKLSA